MATAVKDRRNTRMAGKKSVAKAVAGKKVPKGAKPVVIFLPKLLHSRARLASTALGVSLSEVVREMLQEYIVKNKKKIQQVLSMDSAVEDEDEETTADNDEDETEDSDDDEEESDDDEDDDE